MAFTRFSHKKHTHTQNTDTHKKKITGDPEIPSEASFLRKYSPYHVLDDRVFGAGGGGGDDDTGGWPPSLPSMRDLTQSSSSPQTSAAQRKEVEARTSVLPSI